MTKYDIYNQSSQKHFQYFADKLAYIAFEMTQDEDSVYKLSHIKLLCSSYHVLMEKCESPIERIMASVLLFLNDGYGFLEYLEDVGEGEDVSFNAYFTSQHKILKYRADFLVRIYMEGKFHDIIIECDGHEFHEKTKEQASRDKKRDRELSKLGLTILRFSGSDIYSKTEECAQEIEDFIYEKRAQLMLMSAQQQAGVI